MNYDQPYEHPANRGSLFYNDRKETKNDPAWKGDGKIDLSTDAWQKCGISFENSEVPVWLNIWVEQTKSGKKKLNLSIQPKDAEWTPKPKEVSKPEDDPLDDDIPF